MKNCRRKIKSRRLADYEYYNIIDRLNEWVGKNYKKEIGNYLISRLKKIDLG